MYGQNAAQLYALLKQNGIVGAEGSIKLELLNTRVDVNDKSSVGNLIQEWLGQWMSLNGVFNRGNVNTQAFPDFYLSEDDVTNLLEIKAFDYLKSPNFDVAQFDAYVRSLRTNAYRLDADYLIFGYALTNGILKINDVWLKKIWEITCPSEQFALKTNVKQGKIHNIRPYNFKTMSLGYQPFENRAGFVLAIKDTLTKYTSDHEYANEWYLEVANSYEKYTKEQL